MRAGVSHKLHADEMRGGRVEMGRGDEPRGRGGEVTAEQASGALQTTAKQIPLLQACFFEEPTGRHLWKRGRLPC